MSRTPEPATADARAVLARRASTLAQVPHDEATGAAASAALPVILARRGGASFAVRAADVRDGRTEARVTPLPGADRPVVGLVAWRGQGLIVHDVLAPGAGATFAETSAPWLLVVGERGNELALVADEVDDLVELSLGALLPAPEGTLPAHGATADGTLVLDLRGWLALHTSS